MRQRRNNRFKMSKYDYDLFVIGAGSGGVRAARMAAGFGARVAVAEERYLGGTCVNVGCVPKKLFSYAAHYGEDFHDARGFGWNSSKPDFDWSRLRDNKTTEIERLNGIYRNLLTNAGAELMDGHATIIDPVTVDVAGRQYSAERILIAVGGWPWIPEFPGSDLAIDSNQIFSLESLPDTAVVVGGGYIATEFAGILNGLGVNTTQIYRGELFLRGFDQELREHLAAEMRKKGVDLRFNEVVESMLELADGQRQLSLKSGEKLEAGLVLYATGRKPLLQGLGLESVNVAINKNGYIEVDEHYQSTEPSIFALGDVTGGMELTPVALAEGMAFARRFYDDQQTPVDYDFIPTAVFSQPNLATVGFTEEQAREQFENIRVYTSDYRPLKHTLSGSDERGFMKMIVDDASDRVVGVHLMGAEVGEMMQGIAVAMKAGATKAIFDSTIGIHPTAAEEFVTLREVTRR